MSKRLREAQWIGAPIPDDWSDETVYPPIVLRRGFVLDHEIEQTPDAKLEITALGLYEAVLNGVRVGDQQLAPEWTDYNRRVQVQSYEVGDLLSEGANEIEVTLADGWYSGRVGLSHGLKSPRNRGLYGERPRILAALIVDESTVVVTDGTWEYTDSGPIRSACLLDGETRDFSVNSQGSFHPVAVDDSITTELVPQSNEPIRITDELATQSVIPKGDGRYIVDFGQNLAGWIRVRLHGERGDDVRIRHGEMLDADGELYRNNLRIFGIPGAGAQQEDHAILSGESGGDLFEPRFTYHGFRYVELDGLREAPSVEDLTACVVHSDCPTNLEFECSNPLLNRLMETIDWTLRDNLHSTPTDCPQRDERLGWMGDAQVFAQTACYLRDMRRFYEKWMQDVVDAQTDDGRFPDFAPHPFEPERHFSGNPGWADAGIVIPYRIWQNYGDASIIDEHFDAMYRWIDAVRTANPNGRFEHLFPSDIHYGDWLNADTFALERFPKGRAATPIEVFATALYARSVEMLAEMAEVTGRSDAAEELRSLRRRVADAFCEEYVKEDGRIRGDTQGAYAFALAYDLLPDRLRESAFAHLIGGIEEFDSHLSTGFLGTIEALKLFSAHGRNDLAYRLVTSEAFPSWGYMLTQGATTIWERWDGYMPGRSPEEFQDENMNSFNHYSIGSVGEWIVRTVGGLRIDDRDIGSAGFRRFVIHPQPGPGVEWSKLAYTTPKGVVRIEWHDDESKIAVNVSIPEGSEATLIYADGHGESLSAGDHERAL